MESFQAPWKPHRLWTATDATFLSTRTFYAGTRPRGVLSGLFVITTLSEPAQFHSISGVRDVRLRLNDVFYEEGSTVFLAYEHDDTLMLEDVLVWKGKNVWNSEAFQTRWDLFAEFLKEYTSDLTLQGIKLSIAVYTSLKDMKVPPEGYIVEFILNQSRQKRLIVMLEAEVAKDITWMATRETARGPDVYSVAKAGSSESEGIACVQSLAVSRALRLRKDDSFRVNCKWHERFKKWEIVEVFEK